MLRHVLGSYYDHCHGGELSEKRWKHILNKLVNKIDWAIEINLLTDGLHKKKIRYKLDNLKRCISNKENTDPEIIISLVSLCFELIGSLPDNRAHIHANKKSYFNLSGNRSIHYIQSPDQKVRVILDSASYEPFNAHYSYNEMISKYYTEFSNNAQRFLVWYKSQFPQLYSILF